MSTSIEENQRLLEELRAEYATLSNQTQELGDRLNNPEENTAELRNLRERTSVALNRVSQEISRLERTVTANTPEEIQARIEERNSSRGLAEEIINARVEGASEERHGGGPTFFHEEHVQTLYHDFIVYIQGVDVTRYIKGSVSVMLGANEAINTFSCSLNNTGDLFTITPENIAGLWRRGPDEPFSEDAKKAIFDIKNDPARNPFDIGTVQQPGSGSRRWNLAVYGCVFHRMDPIRVWVHNPFSEAEKDEWLPVFTGYLTTKGVQDGWINGESTITINAVDIRDMMRHMRLDRTSLLYETPGGRSTQSGSGTPVGAPRALSINNTIPTFNGEGMQLGYRRSRRRVSASRVERTLAECNEALQRRAATLGVSGSLRFFADLLSGTTDTQNSWAGLSYLRISHAITLGSTNPPRFVNVRGTDNRPEAHYSPTSAVGRMREGLAYHYPDPDSNTYRDMSRNNPDRPRRGEETPTDVADSLRNIRVLSRWHKLCLFGSPVRNDCSVPIGQRLAPKLDDASLRFWSIAEVHAAGTRTVTDDIWAPDMQLVHWLSPRQGTNAGSNGIMDMGVGPDQVAGERNWTTRWELLLELTNMVDYRVWVTGVGDIVFEPPLYDFYPGDFGEEWAGVMTFDQHLIDSTIDDEHSEVPTVFTAIGSITGLTNVPNPENVRQFAPGAIPSSTVWSATLASRFGIKLVSETFGWITDRNKLKSIAVVRFQKHLMEADSFSANSVYRVFMTPNRPFHMIPRDRISLTNSVTHTWEVFGEATSNFDLHGSRYLDIYGVRRNLTGGRALPLSFAAIPGSVQYNTVPIQRELAARIETLYMAGLTPDEIIYGRLNHPRGPNPSLTLENADGSSGAIPKPLTRQQVRHLQAIRNTLRHVDSLANIREEWRQYGPAHARRYLDGARVLARVIDMNAIPTGRAELNVVPGFQGAALLTDIRQLELDYRNLYDAQATANDITRAVRAEMSGPLHRDADGISFGSSGVRTVQQTEDQLAQDRRTYRVTAADPMFQGATAEYRAAFAARREEVRPNIFGCTDVPVMVGFWREMRRAAATQLTELSARSRDLLIGMCAIETGSGHRMANNNVGNIHTFPLHWTGRWHQSGAVPFNSYDSLQEGLLDLLRFIQARFGETAYRLLLAGEVRYIYHVYSRGYSGARTGTPEAAQEGESKQRELVDILAIVRRMDAAGTITNAPECDPTEQQQRSQTRADAANRASLLRARAAARAARNSR
jgi:hypothetical protein